MNQIALCLVNLFYMNRADINLVGLSDMYLVSVCHVSLSDIE